MRLMTIPATNANTKPAAKYVKKKQALPQAIRKAQITTLPKKNITAFSGKDDIQFNFYPCNIKIFGISLSSAEHAFQYSKAMRSRYTVTASVIQKANSALNAKRIAIKITTPDERLLKRDDVMKQILELKFDQVPEFKECVLQCNDKTKFVEAANDDYWGSGFDKRGTHNTATTA